MNLKSNYFSESALGVNLTPIMVKHNIRLKDLRGKWIAVDANNFLYQFLALIRLPNTLPLTAPDGTVTSHITGLFYRTTRLIFDCGMGLIFIFDGKPPKLKEREIEKRHMLREKATREWRQALKMGEYEKAFSKAVMTSRLTHNMIQDAKRLLELMGVPYVQAPSEAEAQASYMAKRGDVWASSSRDYDSLLFGAPKLVRNLTIFGKEFLPSKMRFRPLKPELISLNEFLSKRGITYEQLIDLAILIGTDFNEGVKGIGPKTALKIIKEYGKIEDLPDRIRRHVWEDYEAVRKIFFEPNITSEYKTAYEKLREEELFAFLCDEKGFSKNCVKRAVERIKSSKIIAGQSNLEKWIADIN